MGPIEVLEVGEEVLQLGVTIVGRQGILLGNVPTEILVVEVTGVEGDRTPLLLEVAQTRSGHRPCQTARGR